MKSEQKEKVILGIDPGTNILGYSILIGNKNTLKITSCGVLKLKSTDSHFKRLHQIFSQISALIELHRPSDMAIEAPFYGKNIQSMLKLGRAQGAAILAGVENNLTIEEYSPRRIKQSITGNGNASKERVARMIESMYTLPKATVHLDETDAIAVAVCHYFEGKSGLKGNGKTFKDWGDYLNNNPGRTNVK